MTDDHRVDDLLYVKLFVVYSCSVWRNEYVSQWGNFGSWLFHGSIYVLKGYRRFDDWLLFLVLAGGTSQIYVGGVHRWTFIDVFSLSCDLIDDDLLDLNTVNDGRQTRLVFMRHITDLLLVNNHHNQGCLPGQVLWVWYVRQEVPTAIVLRFVVTVPKEVTGLLYKELTPATVRLG